MVPRRNLVLSAVPAEEATRTLSFGLVGGCAVFMDDRTDTYFSLDQSEQNHLDALLADHQPLAADERLRNALGIEKGAFEITQAARDPCVGSLLDDGPRINLRPIDILRVAYLLLRTRRQLRALAIEDLLRRVSRVDATRARPSRSELIPSAMRFASAAKWMASAGNCLADSLTLLRWLGRDALGVELVFGVKLHPFAAHCWVQYDGLVLNDRLENVAAFTPVRILQCSAATR